VAVPIHRPPQLCDRARVDTQPARWTGQSILDDAISPQVAVNHGASSILENASTRHAEVRPVGSINPDWLSDHPGEPLEYTPGDNGAKPGWEAAALLPQWMLSLPQRSKATTRCSVTT
jgi:hypothetical protein